MKDLVRDIVTVLESHRNPKRAAWHYAYLRGQFPFLGLPQPLRKRLQKDFLPQIYTFHIQGDPIIKTLWNLEEREYLYLAMDTLSSHPLREKDFPLFEELITTKPWWDTVDVLASNHMGKFFRKFPSYLKETERWICHSHLWLRRAALLFQLRYKRETDEKRLFSYCIQRAEEKEFFIQRAIAWALREYAKTSPKSVEALLKKASFSNLVQREVKNELF